MVDAVALLRHNRRQHHGVAERSGHPFAPRNASDQKAGASLL